MWSLKMWNNIVIVLLCLGSSINSYEEGKTLQIQTSTESYETTLTQQSTKSLLQSTELIQKIIVSLQWSTALPHQSREKIQQSIESSEQSTETTQQNTEGSQLSTESLQQSTESPQQSIESPQQNTEPPQQSIELPKNTENSTDDPNPCMSQPPVKPDFSTLDLRISQRKCVEYIWEMKNRQDLNTREEACYNYSVEHKVRHPAIAGGRYAIQGEFPHMGAIGWKGVHDTWVFKCGSSLISPKFVLTAAHCTWQPLSDTSIIDPVPKIVRLGAKNIEEEYFFPTRTVEIHRIIVHPYYVSPKKYNDIALMELTKSLNLLGILQPACLWPNFDIGALGTKVTLSGWGATENSGKRIFPDLQAADVNLVDSEICKWLLRELISRNWWGLQDHQICAGELSGGVDACKGDSGGPLQVKIPLPEDINGNIYYVIGITSFGGSQCARAYHPTVYTRVSSFIDWIESIVWS